MDLTILASLLRCSRCRSAPLTTTLSGDLVCSACVTTHAVDGRTVRMAAAGTPSSDWEHKQAESIGRYTDHTYNADLTVPELFGGFIAATLEPESVVLDVGCGIAPERPAYARHLGSGYVGLEPLDVRVDRSYFCVSGGMAEVIPFRDATVDAVVFATSLDHIQDLEAALAEVRRVLRHTGRAYFWVGLHEKDLSLAALNLRGVFFSGSVARRVFRLLAAPAVLMGYARVLAKRDTRVRRGVALDAWHFHYFTRRSLRETLSAARFAIERELIVPGTISTFVECRAVREPTVPRRDGVRRLAETM